MAHASHYPPALRPQDGPALAWLARDPFLSAYDLAILLGVEDASGVHRRLRRLAALGLIDHIVPSSDDLKPQWLAYLTNAGLRTAAAREGQDAATFASTWQCGEAGLLRRIMRLDHLVLTRGVLFDLLAGLHALKQPGLALRTWNVWPYPWSYLWHHRRHTLLLDGAGVINRPDGGDPAAWSSFILLWDDDEHVMVEAWRPRLRALLRARHDVLWQWPLERRVFPTVLVVAASPARAARIRHLIDELGRADDMSVPHLVTTDSASLADAGPLAPIWSDAIGQRRPLLAALVIHAAPALDPLRPTEASAADKGRHEGDEDEEEPVRARVLVRGDFAVRASTVGVPQGAGERALVSLALRPRELRALRWIATQPLLTAAHISELTRATSLGISRILKALERHGLIAWDLPTRQEVHAHRRYFLTPVGLHLLAARAGLSPGEYREHTGSLAGDLIARATGPSGGTGAYPRKGTLSGTGLVWLQRYLEHTTALQEIFFAFLRASRAAARAGRDEALEMWSGEWTLARRFEYDGAWHTLRPDAAVCYRVGREVRTFYLELDRGTAVLGDVAEKLETYLAYRQRCEHDGVRVLGSRTFPTILVVTTGEERLCNILDLQEEILPPFTRPLSLLATTAEDLATQGPPGPIWRSMWTEPPRPLFREHGAPSERPYGLDPGL